MGLPSQCQPGRDRIPLNHGGRSEKFGFVLRIGPATRGPTLFFHRVPLILPARVPFGRTALMFRSRLRRSLVLGAFSAMLTLIAADVADARFRISVGSRGTRSYSAPPATKTVPTPPVERRATQPVAPGVI